MTLATTSSSLSRSPSTSAVVRALIRPSRRLGGLADHRGAEVGDHLLDALEHLFRAAGVVLEVAEHLGEILGPGLEQLVVGGRHPEHLGGHDRGQRVGEAVHHVKAAPASQSVDEGLGDLTDVLAQHCDAAGREGRRGQAADAAVLGGIEEQHLPHHHRRDRGQLAHAELLQSLGWRRPCRPGSGGAP